MKYMIRRVELRDLERVAEIESECFPVEEAADKMTLKQRIETFPESFFVAEEDGSVIAFINGCMTDNQTICDEMFENTESHIKNGAYQSIFGLDVRPERRKMGIAAALMERMIGETKKRGKRGLILTCKEKLIPYYTKFGYRNIGVSSSTHGGAVWYDMILEW